MIGPSPSRKGGIAAVANVYLNSYLVKEVDLTYISSTSLGTKFDKCLTVIRGYAIFVFFLTSRSSDIIHILVTAGVSFYRKIIFILLAKTFKKKIVIHLHASNFEKFYQDRKINRYVIKKVMDNVDLILVLSDRIKQIVKCYSINDNIKVLYNPISFKDFSFPSKIRKSNTKIVLFMGKVGERKGVYDLLEAIPKILKIYNSVRFVLGGDGELEKVKHICKIKKVANKVDVLGYISGSEKMNNFKKADIYILPSYHEGLPVSILEAMATGLPIVSTAIAGIPDAVEDGVNGFLIEPGHIDAIVEKVTKLLRDEHLCNEMSKRSIAKVRTKFDISVIIEHLVQEYKALLN